MYRLKELRTTRKDSNVWHYKVYDGVNWLLNFRETNEFLVDSSLKRNSHDSGACTGSRGLRD